MSYLYIFVATLMFSFVGTLVKVATPMAPSSAVTLSRFFFGVFFLLIVCIITKHKPKLLFTNKWIWVAVIGKCINYFCENIALQQGATFGNIIVYPSQAVTMCLLSAIFFGEKIGLRKILSTILCVSGILIISWNGDSLSGFFGDSLPLTLLFVLAAVGSATFIFCQKMLIQTLPSTLTRPKDHPTHIPRQGIILPRRTTDRQNPNAQHPPGPAAPGLSVTNPIAHSIPPLQLTAPKCKNTVKPEGSTVYDYSLLFIII